MLTIATVPVPFRPTLAPVSVPVISRDDASAPGWLGWKVTPIWQSTVVSALELQLSEPICEKSGLPLGKVIAGVVVSPVPRCTATVCDSATVGVGAANSVVMETLQIGRAHV